MNIVWFGLWFQLNLILCFWRCCHVGYFRGFELIAIAATNQRRAKSI